MEDTKNLKNEKKILLFKEKKEKLKMMSIGILRDGRILTSDRDNLYIVEIKNFSIQITIQVDTAKIKFIQMKNKLLIISEVDNLKVIKLLPNNSYKIIQIMFFDNEIENKSIQLQESLDEIFILGQGDLKGWKNYSLSFYYYKNEKYQLKLKIEFDKLVIREPTIFALENKQVLIYNNHEGNFRPKQLLIFINNKKGNILHKMVNYNIANILKYDKYLMIVEYKDYLYNKLNSNINLFNWKTHEIILTISTKKFIPYYCFNNFIIGQIGNDKILKVFKLNVDKKNKKMDLDAFQNLDIEFNTEFNIIFYHKDYLYLAFNNYYYFIGTNKKSGIVNGEWFVSPDRNYLYIYNVKN